MTKRENLETCPKCGFHKLPNQPCNYCIVLKQWYETHD